MHNRADTRSLSSSGREQLEAAGQFARRDSSGEIAADLHVMQGTVRRWRQGGTAAPIPMGRCRWRLACGSGCGYRPSSGGRLMSGLRR